MGSGFRVWTAGEVVSASNVNNYLQEQTVMSFAGTAARSSAIASPEEGMLSYLQDSDTYQGYNGTSWVNLNTLSGTDTSGLVHINTTSFSAVASQSIDNVFSSAYKSYQIVFRGVQSIASGLRFRVRASGADLTTNTYKWAYHFNFSNNSAYNAGNNNADSIIDLVGGNTSAGFYILNINNPFVADYTSIHHRANFLNSVGESYNVSGGSLINNTTSYDGFTLLSASGNLTGSLTTFGIKD